MNETRCFFLGLGVGLAAGVLFSPGEGGKTRKALADKVREGQDYAMRQGAELRDTVLDSVERTKRAAKTTADGVSAAFEAGKSQLVG